jgi:hypothetical protein
MNLWSSLRRTGAPMPVALAVVAMGVPPAELYRAVFRT